MLSASLNKTFSSFLPSNIHPFDCYCYWLRTSKLKKHLLQVTQIWSWNTLWFTPWYLMTIFNSFRSVITTMSYLIVSDQWLLQWANVCNTMVPPHSTSIISFTGARWVGECSDPTFFLIQFNSIRFLTCTFRASCYSTRLSWAHTPDINWVVCLGQMVSSY